jgi:hypothetical protein
MARAYRNIIPPSMPSSMRQIANAQANEIHQTTASDSSVAGITHGRKAIVRPNTISMNAATNPGQAKTNTGTSIGSQALAHWSPIGLHPPN